MQGSLVTFELKDCPVVVRDGRFILANRPNSSVLRLDTFSRMMDHCEWGEGDVVELDGNTYRLVWTVQGFSLMHTETHKMSAYRDVPGMERTLVATPCNKNPIPRYKCRGHVCTIHDFAGTDGTALFIRGFNSPVLPGEVQVSIGNVNGIELFLGDLYRGQPLILKNGRIRPYVRR